MLLITKSIIDNPEHVFVKEIEDDYTSVFEIRVAKPDVGKVLGKETKRLSRSIQ